MRKSKWIALLLCVFDGFLDGHKFYEGKTLMGILYFFTAGFLFVGVVLDFIALLFKPDPYFCLTKKAVTIQCVCFFGTLYGLNPNANSSYHLSRSCS
ncbi:TM2 domain-containing protein [Paenibacillus donghaensis]|uniref:TM2 domain-containing protein n=1 Tax=Paenibacillus donghaensis TaxID=414771 RepID=UPI001B80ADC8|nr:TM2 domain-containing protein [Paenibacillus donghaensis]